MFGLAQYLVGAAMYILTEAETSERNIATFILFSAIVESTLAVLLYYRGSLFAGENAPRQKGKRASTPMSTLDDSEYVIPARARPPQG